MQCTVCWQQLEPGAVYCPSCRAATPALGAAFADRERRLAQLRTGYRAGNLSKTTYDAEVQRLVVRDQAGNTWWLGGQHGAWFWYNGRSWEPRDPVPVVLAAGHKPPGGTTARPTAPAVASTPAVPPSQPAPEQKRRRPVLLLGCLGLFLFVVIVGGAVAFLLLRDGEAPAGDSGDAQLAGPIPTFGPEDVDQLRAALQEEIEDQRPETLAMMGRPDAFTITELEVEGMKLVRESWFYFGLATQVDFVNGEAAFTTSLDPAPVEAIFPAWYDPLAFSPGMSAAEVIEIASAASPAGAVPEPVDMADLEETLPGGELLVGDQILIGLYGGRVVYVETVAFFPEEGIQ